MRRTLCYSAIMLLGILVLAGCKKEEPIPETPPPPPPPTADQILGEFRNALAPLTKRPVGDSDRQAAVSNITPLLSANRNSVNGPEAISRLRTEVSANIQQAIESDLQGVVYGYILVYEQIDPGNDRYAKKKQRALDVLNRPKVTCNGFVESNGELHVNLEVYDKELKKTSTYFVMEGDLFHQDKLQLVKVIGNQSEVQLKYLKTDDTWVVPGPKERRKSN